VSSPVAGHRIAVLSPAFAGFWLTLTQTLPSDAAPALSGAAADNGVRLKRHCGSSGSVVRFCHDPVVA
jgi:hypothetical protein